MLSIYRDIIYSKFWNYYSTISNKSLPGEDFSEIILRLEKMQHDLRKDYKRAQQQEDLLKLVMKNFSRYVEKNVLCSKLNYIQENL